MAGKFRPFWRTKCCRGKGNLKINSMNSLKEYIKETGWAKLAAVMNIVGGILSMFGILSIPIGILAIIAGIKLWNTANNLENYKNTEKKEDLKEALNNLSDYFTWYGWMIALSLAIWALVFIVILVLLMIVGIRISSMPGLE